MSAFKTYSSLLAKIMSASPRVVRSERASSSAGGNSTSTSGSGMNSSPPRTHTSTTTSRKHKEKRTSGTLAFTSAFVPEDDEDDEQSDGSDVSGTNEMNNSNNNDTTSDDASSERSRKKKSRRRKSTLTGTLARATSASTATPHVQSTNSSAITSTHHNSSHAHSSSSNVTNSNSNSNSGDFNLPSVAAGLPQTAPGPFSARKVLTGMFTTLRASPAPTRTVSVNSSLSTAQQAANSTASTTTTTVAPQSQLFVAAKQNDVEQVRRLVEPLRGSSTDLNALRNGAQSAQTPLHVAASAAVAKLITGKLPGLVDVPDDELATPLLAAIRNSRFDVALHLLTLPGGADRCGRGRYRSAPLHLLAGVPWTASKNAARLFETLLALGASLSELDHRGRTPLHRAAARGNLPAVASILGLGEAALLYARDAAGNTPFACAARGGHVDVLRLLLRDADKSKLDVPRAVSLAQQWQRAGALELLNQSPMYTGAGAGATASAGGAMQLHSSSVPPLETRLSTGHMSVPPTPSGGGSAADMWWSSLLSDDSVVSRNSSSSASNSPMEVSSNAGSALPRVLSLLGHTTTITTTVDRRDSDAARAENLAPPPLPAELSPVDVVLYALFQSGMYRDSPLKIEACVAVLSDALAVAKETVSRARPARKAAS